MARNIEKKAQKQTEHVARGNEKRYFPRWEVNKRGEYCEAGGAAFPSCTKDLSLDGASVLVFGNPPAQSEVRLKIHLAEKEDFEAQGHVAWSKWDPPHKLCGIVFENLSRKAQESITRHAFEPGEEQLLINGMIKIFNSQRVSLLQGNPRPQ